MKVLLIGNGAREHCMAEALAKDSTVFAFMKAKNPGIAKISEKVQLGSLIDFELIKEFAEQVTPDFILVGPENPLAEGFVDVITEFPVVGPDKTLANLESDKGFCRELLKRHNVPGNIEFQSCTSFEEVEEALDCIQNPVVKAAGLAGGKGVKVMGEHLHSISEAKAYAKQILDCEVGLTPRVIIEEKLEGEEFSLQAFVDGNKVVAMPLVQDHKYAYDGDKGPLTGGMGSYSAANHLLPFLSEHDKRQALGIMQATVDALKKDTWKGYKGVLYGGFMLTTDGVKLLEYNVRFGDPEAMNVLPIMENSFSEVCMDIIEGDLESIDFQHKATVCKYVVPEGYPDNPVNNQKIEVNSECANTYYASVDQRDDGLYMSSSRAVAFVGIADTIGEAEQVAGSALNGVSGPVFYRKDIGTKLLVTKRIEHMRSLGKELPDVEF
ncbi:phosphoribosylamine--glycine ligase [archaeon]|nr:phosphoribosylamine--glycine ligase [archaeon]